MSKPRDVAHFPLYAFKPVFTVSAMKRLLFMCALLTCVSPCAWAATYEETFTAKAHKAYNEDINVWVYTSAFAKRFGMPKQWTDNRLKGAYAVACRVERSSARLMFPHKGANVSMAQRDCILDAYVPSDANIPWIGRQIADQWWYTPESPTYLVPQTPEDQTWHQRAVGLPYWGGVVQFGTGDEHLGGFPIREYDKQLYPQVMYISFSFGCTTPPKTASWIEFHDYTPCKSPKAMWHFRTLRATHRIEIPGSFMKRLYNNWYERSRRPSRAASVEEYSSRELRRSSHSVR